MGYRHINNLYKDQTILMLRECYALEKIHGTSAHISWRDGALSFSAGGEKHERFVSLFDGDALTSAFVAMGHPSIVVFGEAYGGSQQGQSKRYGKALKFVAFEVHIGETWLSVPAADSVARSLGLEFVHYAKVPTDLAALDTERDAPSVQAKRNGVEGDQPREGVVLRPLVELRLNNGERIAAKHKRDEERETKTPRAVGPERLALLTRASEIADEWVTPTRLSHVLDKMPRDTGIEQTRAVITAMTEDVIRESAGEIVDSKEARAAIGKRTSELFRARLDEAFRANHGEQ